MIRTAGIAQMFSRDVFKLNGVRFDESNPPWWVTAILSWIAMYKRIQESVWEGSDGYRSLLELKIKTEPPSFLYEFFASFATFEEAARK